MLQVEQDLPHLSIKKLSHQKYNNFVKNQNISYYDHICVIFEINHNHQIQYILNNEL